MKRNQKLMIAGVVLVVVVVVIVLVFVLKGKDGGGGGTGKGYSCENEGCVHPSDGSDGYYPTLEACKEVCDRFK